MTIKDLRKGMVLVHRKTKPPPAGVYDFEAKVFILHTATTMRKAYQPIIHCGAVEQTASIIEIDSKDLSASQ